MLRDYQRRAVNDVIGLWHAGVKRVCLVAPTGSGKSVMAKELVRRARAAGALILVFVHRRELVGQMIGHLESFGERVGAICPGFRTDESAPIQVATVQSMIGRVRYPKADLVIFDEAHHYVSEEWKASLDAYQSARVVGLTATPERGDGKPLGDMFESLVVAAQYSDLIQAGHLVPCKVWHPPEALDGVAQDPVDAYEKYGEGKPGFVFASSVDHAYELSGAFNARNIPSAVVEANTADEDRKLALSMFRAGKLRLLVNVFVFTEGTDIPAATVCLLTRNCAHPSTMIQMTGRVLRPSPGKEYGILIDLRGSVLSHGLPTADREYSLNGKAIDVAQSSASLRVCLECGYTYEGGGACPSCGFQSLNPTAPPRIYSIELREVFAGAGTPISAKVSELRRLRTLAGERGWSLGWVAREYRKLFGEPPAGFLFSQEEKRREWDNLVGHASANGYQPGWAYHRFKSIFGCSP